MDMTAKNQQAGYDWPEAGSHLQPVSRQDAKTLVRQARANGKTIGSPLANYQWDWSRLENVVSFAAKDMLITVETGLTLKVLKDLVEKDGLWLPLDLPRRDDLSLSDYLRQDLSLSWLSHRHGTLKDWVMRMTAIDDKGHEVSSGAEVVKNVAGYQLAPLYLGAQDCLGPIIQVSFRLIPVPNPLRRITWESESIALLWAILQAAAQASHPSGRGNPWEGLRLARVAGIWHLDGMTRCPEDEVSSWSQRVRGDVHETTTEIHIPTRESETRKVAAVHSIQVLPSRIAGLLTALPHPAPDLACYPAAGIVRVSSTDDVDDKKALEGIFSQVVAEGGRVRRIVSDLDPVELPEADRPLEMDIMKRVKSVLDPKGVFGPLPETLW